MFDKLIESNSAGAEFKPRRTFFMVSFVVVGIVFLSALVFDLYAADIDLGTDNFELTEILAPVDTEVLKPEPPRQQQQQKNETQQTVLPVRNQAIAPIEQSRDIPDTISTTPFTGKTLPTGPVVIDPLGAESNGTPSGPVGASKGGNSSGGDPVAVVEVEKLPEPPPAAKAKPPITITKGVVNGTAIELPKPPYPPVARSINLTGSVSVQVLINESGDVVSARAVDGHPFFKAEAEKAARRAKFRPTLLSNQAVKVNGVIVYKFVK